MLICKHCQAELPEHIRFCGRCGNSFEEDLPSLPEKQALADFPTAFLPSHTQHDQLPQDMPGTHTPQYASPSYSYDRPEDVSEDTEDTPAELAFGAINLPSSQPIVPLIQGEDAGFGQHGLHHQPQILHGAHHQAQVIHGAHHQAQAVHGAHHQAQATHNAQHGLKGCRPSCLTMAVSTAAVTTVVAASLLVLFLYILPGRAQPTLNIPTSVSPGEIITAQGSNFSPGQHILITVDKQKTLTDKPASLSLAYLLGPVQVLTQQTTQQGTLLTVKNNGTFTTTLNVQASIVNLAAGTYTGHATFYPGTATVTVVLNIQPVLNVQPPCISVQGSPLNISVMEGSTSPNAGARVSISNGASRASGTWTAQLDVPWITLSTSSGFLNAGATTVIPTSINESAVGTGNFSGHITFSPGSDSSVMTINLTVYRRLCINPNPTSLSFPIGSPASQTFTVTNCATNAGTLSISSITTDTGGSWLHATGGGPLDVRGSQTFTVTVGNSNPAVTAYISAHYTGHTYITTAYVPVHYTGHIYITMTGSDGGTTSIRVDIDYYV
jgi:hypothetical protein